MKSLISCNADFIAERNVDCKRLAKNRFLMPNDLTSNSVNCACCLLLINFMNPIYSLTGRPSPNIASVLSISYTTVTLDHPTTQQKHLLVAFLQDQRRHEIPAITELRARQAATVKLMARRDETRRDVVTSSRVVCPFRLVYSGGGVQGIGFSLYVAWVASIAQNFTCA